MVPGVPMDNGSVPRISTNGSEGSSRKNNQQNSGSYTLALYHNITNSSSRDCIVIKSRPKSNDFLMKGLLSENNLNTKLIANHMSIYTFLCVASAPVKKIFIFIFCQPGNDLFRTRMSLKNNATMSTGRVCVMQSFFYDRQSPTGTGCRCQLGMDSVKTLESFRK